MILEKSPRVKSSTRYATALALLRAVYGLTEGREWGGGAFLLSQEDVRSCVELPSLFNKSIKPLNMDVVFHK